MWEAVVLRGSKLIFRVPGNPSEALERSRKAVICEDINEDMRVQCEMYPH
jgi:hypothetical protein